MIQGTLALGIVFVTIISWIPGHAASYIGEGSNIIGAQPSAIPSWPLSPSVKL